MTNLKTATTDKLRRLRKYWQNRDWAKYNEVNNEIERRSYEWQKKYVESLRSQ